MPGANTGVVRPAREQDLESILELVQALAEYEKEADAVEATLDDFREALFGADRTTYCHVVEVDGTVVGIAIWFLSFSTWTGKRGIWLEDLFVLPEHRGSGFGKALLAELAQVCVERGYTRLEWWVLDWNAPSIAFYESLGAVAQDEWTTFRLDGDSLRLLGANR